MCSAFTKNFEQTITEYSFFMPDFVSHVCLQYLRICNNDLLDVNRSVVESCCLLDSAVPSLDFELINGF